MSGYTTKWQPGNRKTKYGAKSTIYNKRKYDSKAEANYATQLDWRVSAGEIIEVVPQFRLGLYIGGSLWKTWKVDFKVILKNGDIELHEVKGFETMDYLMKRDALLLIKDGECKCNYITDYQTGKVMEEFTLIVVK